jgi:hypothetical protein
MGRSLKSDVTVFDMQITTALAFGGLTIAATAASGKANPHAADGDRNEPYSVFYA